MFIRVKKVHEYEYAYLCRSVWNAETKKSKQVVVVYLGNLRSAKRLSKMDFDTFNDEQRKIIDAYLEKMKGKPLENDALGDKKKAWKSMCPSCDGVKARQARICRRCSTNNRFHGWATPAFAQEYSYKYLDCNTKSL